MSYFTETFERILEFKGEAELAYAKRRYNERGTGIHNGVGKHYSKEARNSVNSNDHTTAYKPDSKDTKKDVYDKQVEHRKKLTSNYNNYMK